MENETIEIEDTICPTCKKIVTGEEADAVHDIGECLGCDHIRGEVAEELNDQPFDDSME